HFSQPDMHRIRASLAAEECPAFQDWAERTLAAIDAKSPLAMCVTLELLRQGRELTLADCFALELHLDSQWFADGDIMERSEEHTSELQSRENLVCRLLLEKKNKTVGRR